MIKNTRTLLRTLPLFLVGSQITIIAQGFVITQQPSSSSTAVNFINAANNYNVIIRRRNFYQQKLILSEVFSSPRGFGGGKSTSTSGKKNKNKKNAKKPNNTISQPYTLDESDTTKKLLQWLDTEEVEGLEGIDIGFSELKSRDNDETRLLRGVFAKEDFQPGEYIMAVPFVTTLLIDEHFEIEKINNNEINNDGNSDDITRAGFQFWNNFLSIENDESPSVDNNNKYKAYLDFIPMSTNDPHFDATPDFWSTEEIQQLEFPSIVENMLSRKLAITKLIQHATWIIQSRAFTIYKKAIDLDGNNGLLSRVVLIPFFDMLNHASSSSLVNAEMEVVETKEYDESMYALVATRPIKIGTEIKMCYGTGQEISLELFCKYGFLPNVENIEEEKLALEKFLLKEGKEIKWSTSLEDDRVMLGTEIGRKEPMRTILSIRIYVKSILSS